MMNNRKRQQKYRDIRYEIRNADPGIYNFLVQAMAMDEFVPVILKWLTDCQTEAPWYNKINGQNYHNGIGGVSISFAGKYSEVETEDWHFREENCAWVRECDGSKKFEILDFQMSGKGSPMFSNPCSIYSD